MTPTRPAHRIRARQGVPSVPRISSAAGVLSLWVLFLATGTALALVAPEPTALDGAVRQQAWIIEQPVAPEATGVSALASAAASFKQKAGLEWRTPLDRRTGRALLFQGGPGIPMFPGAGNALKASDMAADFLDGAGKPTLAGIESLARTFFAQNGSLFLPDKGTLILNPDRSGVLDDGRVAYADFDWLVDGVPVLGARVFARINSGNLVQAGTHLVGAIDTPTTPRLTASEALTGALAHAGLNGENEIIVQDGRLLLLPVADQPAAYAGPTGAGLFYRLVWEVAFKRIGEAPTWTARVDALSGEVVEFFDANQYAAQVTGGVYPRTVTDPETVWPFVFTSLTGGGAAFTDMGGKVPFLSPEVSTQIDGRYFSTSCQSCTGPAQPVAVRGAITGTGVLRFGTGGVDAVGNGTSTKADRNAFYHLTIVRFVAKKWLSIGWLDATFPANVNINASCNAYYDGASVNFYRSSGSCNNTGEIADIMQHEWGHGLDGNTLPGDGATGEATADTTGVHVTHSFLVGPNFSRSGSPVRNLNKATTSKGLLTVTNVVTKCNAGSGPLGREVHCEGEVYGQTTWDTATALIAKYGNNTGWRESERLFFVSLPQSGIYLPDQSGSIYDAYIAADDDDGNLGNGTPNGAEIFAAFNLHEMAGGAVVSSAHCARPAQAAVVATPGCDQIALTWNAVPGATSYRVQKHWSTVASPFLNVATVTGTSYTDTQAMAGVTYHYVVQAVAASGCESSIDTEALAAPSARPLLDVSAVTADDTPAGNRSGSIDPGESVDLTVTLDNVGPAAAAGISGTLSSSTPGVTVTSAGAAYPALPPDGSGTSASAYRIAVSSVVACGTPINLSLGVGAQGVTCPLAASAIQLTTGTQTVVVDDPFETSTGWAYDAANSTASTGGWVRGDPTWTNFQAGDDATATGANCWYTGSNGGGLDETNDVDGGQVTLLSPVYNLAGRTNARLTYQRWFGQRDLGDDAAGDFFIVEVSNNGGTSWTALESLGDAVNAPFWVKKDFALETIIPLTANMRFRARASDTGTGAQTDIIEAAIDDFKITTSTCDSTPPCFASPAFAGLSSVTPAGTAACGAVDLSWPAASSNCQNATMTFNIYRGTSPGFTPSPANRVAASVAGFSYRDTLFAVGTTYYFIVRANDSRSGEDANAVVRSVVAPNGPDAVAPLFPGVASAVAGLGCGETALSWAPAQDCSAPVRYKIYRSQDPYFLPSQDSLIGETASSTFVDAALVTGSGYTYIVRAHDDSGNEETNSVRASTAATVLPRTVFHRDFESGPGGFAAGSSTASAGTWQLGDPVGTGAQPEDDTTPSGVNCWATGLAGGGIADNDVDGGYAAFVSPVINLAGVNNPTVRYQRWFSNDQGPNPSQDTFYVEVSNDGGAHYSFLDTTTQSSNGWEQREIELAPLIGVTANMRFQFTAQDEPDADSVVEAAIDDFDIIEPTGGCSGCAAQAPVGKILVTKSAGGNLNLDWTGDPVSAPRYVVYRVTGAAFEQPSRIGTTTSKSFTHVAAASIPGPIYYFVSAVNACGAESAYNTP